MVKEAKFATLTLDYQGRLLLPKHIRQSLGVKPGSRLVALVDGGRLILEPWEKVEAELWAEVADIEESLTEELLEERRREAVKDA
jgi:AbrB family looped-hinge helix DNA binding protein